ncbi:MAG TPA: hypothetical protein DCS43_09855 [Verrucomicrobia bacterium]|nr:hypothetical protein [Verrucomicrobiota bacterium]
MMATTSIYEALPFLERDWEAMAQTRATEYARIKDWYYRRLRHVSGPICELGCGYGRLIDDLARSGIEVHGTDAAEPRVNAAREHFAKLGIQNAVFHHCKMPSVPEGIRFDAVLLATNAIGYVQSDREKNTLLNNIHGMLKEDGLLLMDHGRGVSILKLLRYWPGLRGKACTHQSTIRSSLHWSRKQGAIRESFLLQGPHDKRQLFTDLFRFDKARKTLDRLRSAGFAIEETCGSFAGSPFRPWSRMIAIVARKEKRDDACHH